MAIAATVLISWLNYIGVRRAGEFQFLFTLLKVAIILGIVAVGFSYSGGTWANFATEFTGAKGGVAGFFAALVAALWAYDGWNDLNMVAGEIRNPQRNIPLALIWGVATVGALYILVNAAVQYVLPAAAIAGSERPASDAVALVLGHAGASLVSAGMAVSMLVTLNGTIMSGARVPFATARDGYFFKAIAEVHPRFHTPSVAIVVQCGLAIVLLLLGGSFRQFFSLAIFAEWMFYMIAGSTVFVFRRREPHADRPYRVWGYPVVPAIVCAGLRGPALLHVHRQSEKFGWRMPGDSGGRSGVLLFCAAPGSWRHQSNTGVIGRRLESLRIPRVVTKGHAQGTRLPPAHSPIR